MQVIGIGSQAQHGKDTLADYLQKKLNDRLGKNFWGRGAFARAVKRIYCETFGVDFAFVEKWKLIDEPPPGFDMTVRKALQFIGDGFRMIKGNVWIELFFRELNKPTILSDARYINELRETKKYNSLVILVARPDKLNDDPNGSESQIRPLILWAIRNKDKENLPVREWLEQTDYPPGAECVDRIIINDGSEEQFFKKIDDFIVPEVESVFKE